MVTAVIRSSRWRSRSRRRRWYRPRRTRDVRARSPVFAGPTIRWHRGFSSRSWGFSELFADSAPVGGRIGNMRSLAIAALLLVACEDPIVTKIDPILKVSPEHIDFGTVEVTQQKV